MKRTLYILVFPILLSCQTGPINPIKLVETKLKVKGNSEEVFYHGFAEGDELMFNLHEANGRKLNEIEITRLPSHFILMDYGTATIDSFKVTIRKKGIYRFRIKNAAKQQRICQYTVQRTPANNKTAKFDSNVHWRTVHDTTYTQVEESYLMRDEIVPTQILSPSKYYINSGTNALFKGGNSRILLPVSLPENTVAWYYEFSAYRDEDQVISTMNTFDLAGELSKLIDQSGAVQIAISSLTQPPGGDVCEIFLITHENYENFKRKTEFEYYPIGSRLNINSGVVKVDRKIDEDLYLGIKNPDSYHGVYCAVEVVALVHEQEWGTRTIEKPEVTSRKQAYLLD